MFSKTACSYS